MRERRDLDTFIGLDVGTTNCKAVVVNEVGRPVGQASREYSISLPSTGWAEQDALEVWQTVKEVIRNAVSASGVTKVNAISLSVQGDAVVAVDRRLNPLRPFILGMDYRSKPQSDRCAEVFGGEDLFRVTGMPPHPLNSLTKILWIKEQEPEIYEAAWKFMTYADYILAKLGADPVIDYTMASRTMAFDLASRSWSDQILSKLGISKDLLSSAVPSGQVVGRLLDSLRDELNIASDVALVTGGHDQACAALGAGVIGERVGWIPPAQPRCSPPHLRSRDLARRCTAGSTHATSTWIPTSTSPLHSITQEESCSSGLGMSSANPKRGRQAS